MTTYKDNPPPYTYASTPPPPPPPAGVHEYYAPTAPLNQPYVPTYGTHTTVIMSQPEIVIVGACPACRIGILEDDYTCLGLLCAILFFPLGILCCLALKNRRCSNCGAYFG